MYHYVRNLESKEQISNFLKNIVEIDCLEPDFQKYVQLIYTYENEFRKAYDKQTLYDKTLRDSKYFDDLQRKSLAKIILHDLLTLPILDSEISISQGIGGSLPKNLKPKEERQAYYIIGLPTSGKSYIANILSTIYSACVIDIDIAARKFPEYKEVYGSCVTHSEANRIVFGTGRKVNSNSFFSICMDRGWNIVIPKIGNKIEVIIDLAQKLIKNNYSIHLLLTKIDRKTSVKRSFERFLSTQRYVSLPMIFDWYANDPSLAYYELRNYDKLFSSYEAISFEKMPIIIDKTKMHHFKVLIHYTAGDDIMIFFCFSSKDRHCIVESILFHLTNYGLPVWYDRHKMLLGDERDYKNFDEGVNNCNYAIIILSQNTINSKCANEEIDLIFENFQKKQMYVFPLFFNIKASNLPEKYRWMTKLVYKELTIDNDSRSACNHIICRILLDELEKYKIKNINEYLKMYENNNVFSYVTKLINSYCRISDDNHNAQIALLYAGCLYIKENYTLTDIPSFYYKGAQRLFEETRLNLPIDLRETLIFERLFLLLFNVAIFGYII